MSKNAKFCTPNIMILSSDFRFFGVIGPLYNFAPKWICLWRIDSQNVHQNTLYLGWKNQKCISKMKMQNFEKIKSWILRKRFITGQWNFSCRYILRSSPGMQNFMIVWHIVWPIWLKKHFFAFFGPFLGIFRPKILLSIWGISWNFAKRWP